MWYCQGDMWFLCLIGVNSHGICCYMCILSALSVFIELFDGTGFQKCAVLGGNVA